MNNSPVKATKSTDSNTFETTNSELDENLRVSHPLRQSSVGTNGMSYTITRHQFAQMIQDDVKTRPRSSFEGRLKYQTFTRSGQRMSAFDYADKIVSGKGVSVSDPNLAADIIDELNARRVAAMQNNEFQLCKKLRNAIDSVRLQYRLNDRQKLYETIISKLEEKHKVALDELESTKTIWKDRINVFESEHKAQAEKIKSKHEQELNDFNAYWKNPDNSKYFTHRSAYSIQQRAIEHYMLINEYYEAAEKQNKINSIIEKKETTEQLKRFEGKYLEEKQQLLDAQTNDLMQFESEEKTKYEILLVNEKEDILIKQRRVDALSRILEDEKDFGKFVAKRYKCPKERVQPPTVTNFGGIDLPALTKGRLAPIGHEEMHQIKNRSYVSPLSLPILNSKVFISKLKPEEKM